MSIIKKIKNWFIIKFFLKRGYVVSSKGYLVTKEIVDNWTIFYFINRTQNIYDTYEDTKTYLLEMYNINVDYYNKMFSKEKNYIKIKNNDTMLTLGKPIKKWECNFIEVLYKNKIYYAKTKDIKIIV